MGIPCKLGSRSDGPDVKSGVVIDGKKLRFSLKLWSQASNHCGSCSLWSLSQSHSFASLLRTTHIHQQSKTMSSNQQPNRPILHPSSRARTSKTQAGSSSYTQPRHTLTSKQQSQMPTTTTEREVTYEEMQRAYRAANMLESNELLIWHAMERNEVRHPARHFDMDLGADASLSLCRRPNSTLSAT
jgi:hypothetical protein